MFTLNRLSLLGLGAGLVLVGCASPTDETSEPIDVTSAELTEEANPEQTINEEAAPPQLSADEMAALAAVDPSAPQPPAQTDGEGPIESKSDKILVGGAWGMPWGGFYGTGLWGTGWGMPWGGAGFYPGVGVGWGGWGGCGTFGCGRMWW